MFRSQIIAIDGPSGSGKSTLAKALARKLNFDYIDTGAMYRALAWKVLQAKMNLREKRKIVALAKKEKIDFKKTAQGLRIFIDDNDVTTLIRNSKISQMASVVSKIKEVREIMKRKQRELAKNRKVILEGRDIGTVIFPRADCKIYLDANIEVRAERRFNQLDGKKVRLGKKMVRKELLERDARDTSREVAPLKKADNAVSLDTTNLSIPQMVQTAFKIASKKLKLDVL